MITGWSWALLSRALHAADGDEPRPSEAAWHSQLESADQHLPSAPRKLPSTDRQVDCQAWPLRDKPGSGLAGLRHRTGSGAICKRGGRCRGSTVPRQRPQATRARRAEDGLPSGRNAGRGTGSAGAPPAHRPPCTPKNEEGSAVEGAGCTTSHNVPCPLQRPMIFNVHSDDCRSGGKGLTGGRQAVAMLTGAHPQMQWKRLVENGATILRKKNDGGCPRCKKEEDHNCQTPVCLDFNSAPAGHYPLSVGNCCRFTAILSPGSSGCSCNKWLIPKRLP